MPDQIPLIDPSGAVVGVEPENLDRFLGQGYRPLTIEEQTSVGGEQAEAARYNSPEHTIQAFGQGINRGLSFGLSDLLVDGEEASKLRKYHGLASGLGEATGAISGGLAGASGARAASLVAPSALSARAAQTVARRVAGQEVGRGAAQRIVGGAVEAAVDGGLYGAGQAVSAAALGDDPLTVERLAASIGTGALFGGAIGGGLGAVGAASSAIRKKLVAKANPLLNPRSRGSKELGEHIGSRAKEIDALVDAELQNARNRIAGDLAEADGWGGRPAQDALQADAAQAAQAARRAGNDAVQDGISTNVGRKRPGAAAAPEAPIPPARPATVAARPPRGLAAFAADAAATQKDELPAGLVAGLKDTQVGGLGLKDTNLDVLPLGRQVGDEAKAAKAAAKAGAGDTLPGVPSGMATPGEGWLEYAIRQADAQMAGVKAEIKAARSELRKRFGDDLKIDMAALVRKRPADVFKSVEAWDRYGKALAEIDKIAGSDLAARLSDLAPISSKAGPDLARALEQVGKLDRRGIADALKLDVDRLPAATSGIGDLMLRTYTMARFAEDFGAKAAVKVAESKTDTGLLAGALGAGGALFGGVSGAAAAAALWALGNPNRSLLRLATAAGKIAVKFAEHIDNFVQRVTTGKAPRVANLSVQAVLSSVRFSEEKEDTSVAVPVRRMRELQQLLTNPGRLDAYVDDQLSALRAHNLDLGFGVADAIKMRIRFYGEKMPHLPPPDVFTGFQEEPSEAELSDWSKYVAAGEHPEILLQELRDGDLTPETVETLQAVYPALYGEMQSKLAEAIPNLRAKLQYADKLNLSLLYDLPVEETATDDMFFSLQEMHQLRTEEEQQQTAKPMRGTPKPYAPSKGQLLMDR